jgi:hypothetical protein
MRRVLLLCARAALLLGPTALAFFAGGYFAGPRLVAGAVAFAALAAALVAAERPSGLRACGPAVAAIGGLALLAAWTTASAAWAPLEGPAVDARERALLYLAALWAAALAFGARRAAVWVEPVLAGGVVVVCGYGVLGAAEVVDVTATATAGGRLDQPLTYWNAQGALGAMGLVLCARLAGSRARPAALRLSAAAAAPLLGAAVYLTFSRGALAALGVGRAVLLALTPTWSQLRAGAIAVEAAVLAAIVAEVASGAGLVVALAGLGLLAAAGQAWSAQAEEDETTRTGPLPWTPRVRGAAWAVAALLALAPPATALVDRGEPVRDPAFGATAERLADAGSFRHAYWRVAVSAFAADPAIGVGAGGFQAAWLERRTIDDVVRDAHSLPLETAAELGTVGLLLLALFAGGVVAAGRRVARGDPGLAAGPVAALAVWGAHAAIDWDWEMPALTLVAAVLAGTLVGRAASPRG